MLPLRHIRWAAVVLALSACTHLWEVSQVQGFQTMVDAPIVINAQGTLGSDAVTSVMRQRWKNSYTDTKALAEIEELATGRSLIAGNKVTLLYDGLQTMAAMSAAIASAKDHINLETYFLIKTP
jgi:cardiolipin synthase A/B